MQMVDSYPIVSKVRLNSQNFQALSPAGKTDNCWSTTLSTKHQTQHMICQPLSKRQRTFHPSNKLERDMFRDYGEWPVQSSSTSQRLTKSVELGMSAGRAHRSQPLARAHAFTNAITNVSVQL